MPLAHAGQLDPLLGPKGARTERHGWHAVHPADPDSVALLVRTLSGWGLPVRTEASGRRPEGREGIFLRHPPPGGPRLDDVSGLVRVDAGLGLDELERFLRPRGWTLTGVGWDAPRLPVGTWLETGGRGLPWPAALALPPRAIRFQAVLADGTEVEDGRAPRSAAGPDVRGLWIGAGGAFGVLLGAELSLHRLGSTRTAWLWSGDPAELAAAAGELARVRGPGELVLLAPPGGLVYAGSGEAILLESRAAHAGRLLGRPGEPRRGEAFDELGRELGRPVAGWIEDDPFFGPRSRSAETRLTAREAGEWIRGRTGEWLVAVESPRAFRALSAGAPRAPARPTRGPLAAQVAGIDPEARWNP